MPEESDEQNGASKGREQIAFWQLAPAIEFVCWVVVVLAPMLYFVNGAPMTTDQAYIQVSLVAFAGVGGVSMRFVNLRNAKHWKELLPRQRAEKVT